MSAFYRKCVLLKDSIYLCTWSPLSKPSSSRVQLAHTPALLGVSTPKYPKGGWLSFSEKRERGGWRGRGLWRPPRLPSVSVTYRPSASGLPLDLPKDHFLRVKNNIYLKDSKIKKQSKCNVNISISFRHARGIML
uniref:Uncharacterized protein n=1 Tax=Rousettus aegyptiacus TaxID=9407 RepID=A0A7J8FIW5_ROUAE|nr:hypothetical protein HJG63_011831 [Rousettus aegyptiacus]